MCHTCKLLNNCEVKLEGTFGYFAFHSKTTYSLSQPIAWVLNFLITELLYLVKFHRGLDIA